MMVSLNQWWIDFNWKIECLLLSPSIIDTIFLFNILKLLWHNLFSIKHYINKGELTFTNLHFHSLYGDNGIVFKNVHFETWKLAFSDPQNTVVV